MLCSLILVVNVMHFFKYITFVPLLDFISLMQLRCVFVSVKYWTCKWYFALSLLACMYGCSFLVWMIIVVAIYSDCSFLVKPCFIASFLFYLIALCLFHMHFKFSAYGDRIVLLFSRNTCPYGSRVSQILELGVTEFYSTVSNSHVKSRVYFRVLSRNS